MIHRGAKRKGENRISSSGPSSFSIIDIILIHFHSALVLRRNERGKKREKETDIEEIQEEDVEKKSRTDGEILAL